MTLLTRTIMRIDFKRINTELMNSPGTAVDILYESPEGFWESISESPARRSITAKTVTDDGYRELNLDPHHTVASIEYSDVGFKFGDLWKDKIFIEVSETLDRIVQRFGAQEFSRIGLRFYCLSAANNSSEKTHKGFLGSVASEIVDPVVKDFGTCSDVALIFEGESEHEVQYRVSIGPHHNKDVEKFLLPNTSSVDKDQFVELGYDIMFDIDFFSSDLDFAPFTTRRWARDKIQVGERLAESITTAIRAR